MMKSGSSLCYGSIFLYALCICTSIAVTLPASRLKITPREIPSTTTTEGITTNTSSQTISFSDPPPEYVAEIGSRSYIIRTTFSSTKLNHLGFTRMLAHCQYSGVKSMTKRQLDPTKEIDGKNWYCKGETGEVHFAQSGPLSTAPDSGFGPIQQIERNVSTRGQNLLDYPFNYYEVSTIIDDFDTLAQKYSYAIPQFQFKVLKTKGGRSSTGIDGYWVPTPSSEGAPGPELNVTIEGGGSSDKIVQTS